MDGIVFKVKLKSIIFPIKSVLWATNLYKHLCMPKLNYPAFLEAKVIIIYFSWLFPSVEQL